MGQEKCLGDILSTFYTSLWEIIFISYVSNTNKIKLTEIPFPNYFSSAGTTFTWKIRFMVGLHGVILMGKKI